MNDNLEQKVQWLVDRAQISELLHSFARALDTKDFARYIENYAEDGSIELPQPAGKPGETWTMQRAEMAERVPRSLARYTATHHISSNHQITIEGDSATSRSYLQAVHVSGGPQDHWDAGGWYDCSYRRTPDGWRFVRVKLTPVWLRGEPERFK
ncbi:MAG: hypothetical protein RLZZ200_2084 [Pseudomonadota bacterium]|jgi:ketosteroid isomerase-like protein